MKLDLEPNEVQTLLMLVGQGHAALVQKVVAQANAESNTEGSVSDPVPEDGAKQAAPGPRKAAARPN